MLSSLEHVVFGDERSEVTETERERERKAGEEGERCVFDVETIGCMSFPNRKRGFGYTS